MEPLITYFLGTLAYNLFMAIVIFAIIVYSRRKERAISPLMGIAVFSIGWLAGSLLGTVNK